MGEIEKDRQECLLHQREARQAAARSISSEFSTFIQAKSSDSSCLRAMVMGIALKVALAGLLESCKVATRPAWSEGHRPEGVLSLG